MDEDTIRAIIIQYTGECTCIPAYKERYLLDPECIHCQVDVDELAKAIADAQ